MGREPKVDSDAVGKKEEGERSAMPTRASSDVIAKGRRDLVTTEGGETT